MCPNCGHGQVRDTCINCTRKHLGAVAFALEAERVSASEALEKCIILKNEAMLGYPQHRWLAVGGLSLIVQQALNENKLDLAEKIRSIQKLLESDALELANPDITTLRVDMLGLGEITGGPFVASAQLGEACAECPNKVLKADLRIAWKRQSTTMPITAWLETLT